MAVTIKEVLDKKSLKEFIEFPNRLYKGNTAYVPKIYIDEKATLSDSNPVMDFCERALYLAYKDGEVVGRVAAIINRIANERWNHKEVRFGWIDFIDDKEVSRALVEKVAEFGKARGMEKIAGPLGFIDFDPEGMLVDGYDELCTLFLLYNYPYYKDHFEAMGFTKEVDWIELKIFIPEQLPAKISRVADICRERYGMHIRKISKKEVRNGGYAKKIFDLVNEAYGDLYNYTPLPDKTVEQLLNNYLGFLDLRYVTLIEDQNGDVAALAVTMPSITKALQKCGGKLFPFGWYHILKSMYFKHEEAIELLLVAVKPEHKNKGLMAMIFDDLIPRYIKGGFKYGESNAELESNLAMQTQWGMFENKQTKRRRIYVRDL